MLNFLIASATTASNVDEVPYSYGEIFPQPLARSAFSVESQGPYSCLDDVNRNMRLNWLHIHDSSVTARGYLDENTRVMSVVSRILNKIFNKDEHGHYDGSRVTFSLKDVIDKEKACQVSGTSGCGCSGTEESFSQLTFDELDCSRVYPPRGDNADPTLKEILSAIERDKFNCRVWQDAFENLSYSPYFSRTSIFDGAIDFSDSYYDQAPIDDGVLNLRVITTLTSNCSRVSPRDQLTSNSDLHRGIADQLWYGIMPSLRERWVENPGIDSATGELLEDSCDIRDYPTVDELAMNLSRSSTGLSVVGYNHIYADCDDMAGEYAEEFNDFYDGRVRYGMEARDVPYHYTASDMTEADLTVKLVDAILKASDPCREEYVPTVSSTEAPVPTTVSSTETPVPTTGGSAAGSTVPSTALQDVTFTVGRSAAFSNVITFVKESGSGPDSISFGPNSGTVTVSMGADAIYNLESTTVDGAPGGWFRLSGGQLQLEDTGDGDYNDLTVTPNSGQFTSSTRYQLALL